MNTPQANRLPAWSGLGLVTIAVIAMVTWIFGGSQQTESFFGHLFKTYQPREYCMLYEPAVIWLHGLSDAVIALAYYSIPVALIYFVRRRHDLRFGWMFVCFAVFILACGTTHIMNILALWYAPYRIDGLVKLVTAGASIATAITLWPLIPRALALPSPAALRRANEELEREVDIRRKAEDSLRQMHADLERRVEERTAELRAANARLTEEIAARNSAEAAREALLLREREARAEAENASRTKDEFLATLSHELRTPLTSILGWASMIHNGEVEGSNATRAIETIERNARSQARLIDDLLDVSRIITGNLRLDLNPLNLAPIVDAALDALRPTADVKGIRLQTHFEPKECLVKGDPNRLRQVIWNLLSNAIKFTQRGGSVNIEMKCVESTARLTVSDTGDGISAEFLPYVFDRFRQAEGSISRKQGGLGLGLAVARHLVELHGGTISAESEGLGKGSVFTVDLPMTQERRDPARAEERRREVDRRRSRKGVVRLDGVHVLLVEDDDDSRKLLGTMLRRYGARVTATKSAAEALEAFEGELPDVMISDIGMPDQDGYELIRKLRTLPVEKGGATPAIALTGYASRKDRERALGSGYQQHMAKPIEQVDMIRSIAALIGRGD